MKKVFITVLSFLLTITTLLPSAYAHHWPYDEYWTANSTWWTGCTGLGNVNHTKSLWINSANGPTLLYLYEHEVWVNSNYEIPYMYDVSFMKALHYYDESDNKIAGIGDHEWSYTMHNTVLMDPDWTYTYGHSDEHVWSEPNEDIKVEYDTAARILAVCNGINTAFLGSINTKSDVISNIPSLLNGNSQSEERNQIQIDARTISKGIELKNIILKENRNKLLRIKFGNEEYTLKLTDYKVNKWIERVAIEYVRTNISTGNHDSLINNAVVNSLRQDAILLLADKYNIEIIESELHDSIVKLKQQTLNTDSGLQVINTVVEGLGLNDSNELFFNYDLDHHTNNYIWTKLMPIYTEEYPQTKEEDPNDYRKRLLEVFYEEIDMIMESFSINII